MLYYANRLACSDNEYNNDDCEDNKIVGVITDGYLIRKSTVNFLEMKACQVMEKNHKVKPSGAFV